MPAILMTQWVAVTRPPHVPLSWMLFSTHPPDVSTGDSWAGWSKSERISSLTDRGIPDLQDGMVARMQRVRAGSVLDGLSNVYLLGEKYVQADAYADGSDPGDSSILYAGYSASNVRWGSEPPLQDKANDSHVNAFGSAHSGIWNAAFGDGSVRSMRYNIDPETHKNLSAKTPLKTGEVLADFETEERLLHMYFFITSAFLSKIPALLSCPNRSSL